MFLASGRRAPGCGASKDEHVPGPACPTCGPPDARRILYGFPEPGADELAEAEGIVLGGCVVSVDGSDPDHECRGPQRHRWRST